jgi:16S rRNA U1498 N3-methylase RsmE
MNYRIVPIQTIPFVHSFCLQKNRNDELIEKVHRTWSERCFSPIITDYLKKNLCKHHSPLSKIAISATKQCYNPCLPNIFSADLKNALQPNIKLKAISPILCSVAPTKQWMFDLSLQAGKPVLYRSRGVGAQKKLFLCRIYQNFV